MSRTRIKICGLTRPQDVRAAVMAGADAIGFVFYPPSPRNVGFDQAAALAAELPPFVSAVGLFVNPAPAFVQQALQQVPLQLLQFHGDESEVECAQYGRPWIKAARVRPGIDLVEFAFRHPGARGILLDAFVDGYGGGGKTFDWSLIPDGLSRPLVLSGGLDPDNVGEAVRRIRPFAVDVSSGVESAKGIKDAAKVAAFIAGVRDADG
ncbi:phosphoribosylanthranilate isomerase [Azoarcus communis]|uniref:N-(5'-phosphoribosyl)anthranilate isomerase n=1 Tax=Parazoarcus communis SWub3 = DSM 12120 TaxID=1121029 RepID=A0A323UY63_9RHOO|nr:phosphoribosylanthranilate isomerase [Parazoarcus communis]NMG46848.1 phosphoribosylanthranilate isomerase [Parazoarcus communis]NMG69954.1 phosphoribosylanthranilate isomerase [Parazoarcus communis SWub3 = DSM 12120]PZA16610.1 phosphoribosylanthranilate isomerase [Azoarcus communis] [Parazoarcus communis SWub3 = DSM 12120]